MSNQPLNRLTSGKRGPVSREGEETEGSTFTLPRKLGVQCMIPLMLLLSSPADVSAEEVDRFVLIVAHNSSLRADVPSLQYADDDGARFYELLAPGAKDALLLTTFDAESQALYPHLVDIAKPPTRDNLLNALERLEDRIMASQEAGNSTRLHVFFTGHGELAKSTGKTDAYFSLLDSPWSRDDMITEIVEPQWADITHVTIDACNAFFLVQGRGDWKEDQITDPAYLAAVQGYLSTPQLSERYPTVGFLLSTSGAQEVHEWGRYRAGVFSHQLRSALVGAADVNGDGKLRYDEIEAYIGAANAAVSNPSARISMTSQPPQQKVVEPYLSLSDFDDPVRLQIPPGEAGLFVIEDERGLRYADVSTVGDRELQIMLQERPGVQAGGATFFVRRDSKEARIDLVSQADEGWRPLLPLASLDWRQVRSQPRSAVDEAFRTGLFAIPFGADFHNGYITRSKLVPRPAPQVNILGDGPEEARQLVRLEVFAGFGQGVIARADAETSFGLGVRYGDRAGLFGRFSLDMGLSQRAEFVDGLDNFLPASDLLRGSYSIGGGYGFNLFDGGAVLGGELGIGHMWIRVTPKQNDEGVVQGDQTGFRGFAGGFVDLPLSKEFSISVNFGAAINIASVLVRDDESVLLDEYVMTQLGGQLRLGYRF